MISAKRTVVSLAAEAARLGCWLVGWFVCAVTLAEMEGKRKIDPDTARPAFDSSLQPKHIPAIILTR